MIKYVFICLLLLTGLAAMCQPKKKSVVNLISSERSQGIKRNGADVIKVYHGVFQQDYSILRSDSAYFYPQINSFDAFGHVNINQGDTLNIYSDKLNYNGNTHIALLTDNVRMVDKDATLTTNYLTYNTATRMGTYTGGGKLVNKENTLTSTNGYYFAFTRDSYFRYNVVLNTVDATIKTDTLRYNTGTRISYFYGPTHIYGKKNKDTLYTENGTYNTVTEQAFFGKKNLYTQGTKSLKGDSLFYDRLKGYGRAVKNVVFNDNEQKITLYGDLGTYFQADERTVVTRNPWVTIITEEKDTTKTDTAAKKPALLSKDTKGKPGLKSVPNTKPVTALAESKPNEVKNNIVAKIDSVKNKPLAIKDTVAAKPVVVSKPLPKPDLKPSPYAKPANTTATVKGKDVKKKLIPQSDSTKTIIAKKDTAARIKRDTIYMVADTLETRVLTYKSFKDLLEKRRLASLTDTSAAARAKRAAAKKPSKFLSIEPPKIPQDTSYLHRNIFGPPPKPVLRTVKIGKGTGKKPTAADSIAAVKLKSDSVNLVRKIVLSDTARIRILTGHFNAKLFKSDFQGKADSIFYSSADSTIRCYVKPMMWSQGSQMSGDTIYLQMKNKKLDNMDMFPNAFVVNTENADTAHFNQVAGKKMKGFFADNKLSRMFIDGNAESIYFSRDSAKKVDGMERSLSSRMRINFKNNQASNITFLTKPDHRYGPPEKFKEDEKILKGFIWKPRDRPESKESIIPALDKTGKYKKAVVKAPPPAKTAPANGKLPIKNVPGTKTGKDSTANNAVKPPDLKSAKDSTANKPVKKPNVKLGKDSSASNPAKKPDTLSHKLPLVKPER